jgi:hypothetical protein
MRNALWVFAARPHPMGQLGKPPGNLILDRGTRFRRSQSLRFVEHPTEQLQIFRLADVIDQDRLRLVRVGFERCVYLNALSVTYDEQRREIQCGLIVE